MAFAKHRGQRAKSTEVVFVSTFAIVILFALYSVGRNYSESHGYLRQARALQALEGQDIEASNRSLFHIQN